MKKAIITTILFILMVGLASAVCIDLDSPTQPGNFEVKDSPYDSDGDVGLQWTAASDDPKPSDCPEVNPENLGIDYYEVFMGTSSDFPLNDTYKLAETTELSYVANNLTEDLTYYFKVRAVDKVGNIGPVTSGSTTIGNKPSSGGSKSSSRGGGGGSPVYTEPECTLDEDCTEGLVCVEEECIEPAKEETAEVTTDTQAGNGEETEETTETEETPDEETENTGDIGPTGQVTGFFGGQVKWGNLLILAIAFLLLFLFYRKRKKKE